MFSSTVNNPFIRGGRQRLPSLGMNDDTFRPVSAAPFFQLIDPQPHGIAKFAKLHGWTIQRVSNWRRRGIPHSALPKVAAWMGISVEEYLQRAGQGVIFQVREGRAIYDAGQLWRDYSSLDEVSRDIVDDIFSRARKQKLKKIGE